MVALCPVNRVEISDESDLFLVASSFEPRSVRTTELLDGSIGRAIIFRYDDTIDIESGRRHTRAIEIFLRKKSHIVNLLQCNVKDPFSVVRAFHTLVTQEQLLGSIRSVVVDATCFTKLHLLLLLRFLSDWLNVDEIRVCYTKPMVYATAFGKELSYGIRDTVYLPYRSSEPSRQSTGLIAQLGHESRRLERIIQEIEPERCVVLIGEPGYSEDMAEYSRRVNASLIRRAEYDQHYQLASAPVDEIDACVDVMSEQLRILRDDGCDNVFLAPLGTKIQALAVDVIRRQAGAGRLSLAYSIPDRYERRSYSQGFGATFVATFENPRETKVGIDPISTGGAVVTDDDVNALRDELGI